jgi:REP element-mobilizing transposase RayT
MRSGLFTPRSASKDAPLLNFRPGKIMGLPRFHIEGHIYYITTVIYSRLPIFTQPSFVIPLIDSLNFYPYKQAFKLLGYVIMPDHLHLNIWPFGKATVSDIMRDYKKFTSTRIIRQAEIEGMTRWVEAFEQAGKETGRSDNKVWQDSYWDENIYTERFLCQKLNYIHRNPFRIELVKHPAD